MESLNYPLEQLVTIKKNRFDRAVKVLEEKKLLLEKAHARLVEVSQERDLALEHKRAKLTQLRESLDQGERTDKIQQMKAYLKIVDEQLREKEKKVVEQQKVVDAAQKQVDAATEELFQRKKDLEKLELHKVEWTKELRLFTERKEGVEQDEQGAVGHEARQREKERREKS